MADSLLNPDMFSPESVAKQKQAEQINFGVQERQKQQQVRSLSNPGSGRPQIQIDKSGLPPAQAPPSTSTSAQTPPAMSTAQLRTLAASYATERATLAKTHLDHLNSRIARYHETYKLERKLKGEAKTIPEAQDELKFITKQLGSKNGMGILNSLYFGVMEVVEKVCIYKYNPLGLDVKNLSKRLEEHEPEIAPILLDIAVKYNFTMDADPLLKLLIVTGKIVKEVHEENKRGPRSPYSKATSLEEFSDLGI
jgi:hypothetical protein